MPTLGTATFQQDTSFRQTTGAIDSWERLQIARSATINHLCVGLALLLLLDLQQQRSVDVRKNATECNRRSDQRVQLFVATDGQLEMARSDTLDLEILGSIACQFQDFCGQILEDGGDVDSG